MQPREKSLQVRSLQFLWQKALFVVFPNDIKGSPSIQLLQYEIFFVAQLEILQGNRVFDAPVFLSPKLQRLHVQVGTHSQSQGLVRKVLRTKRHGGWSRFLNRTGLFYD